jgi:hypothetical protein
MRKRVILGLGVLALFLIAEFIFLRVAMLAAGNSHFVTTTAIWVATIPALFLAFMTISLYLAAATLRASQTLKPSWKIFWNLIEIVWLVGTGLSIFGTIAGSANIVVPLIVAAFQDDMRDEAQEVSVEAKNIYGKHCAKDVLDQQLCEDIDKITRLPQNLTTPGVAAFDFMLEVNRVSQKRLPAPEEPDVRKLAEDFWDYKEVVSAMNREPTTITSPAWAKMLMIFAPHILAVVFPLRLGRAIAAFGL